MLTLTYVADFRRWVSAHIVLQLIFIEFSKMPFKFTYKLSYNLFLIFTKVKFVNVFPFSFLSLNDLQKLLSLIHAFLEFLVLLKSFLFLTYISVLLSLNFCVTEIIVKVIIIICQLIN